MIVYGQYCTTCSETARYSRKGKYLGLKPDIYLDSPQSIYRNMRKERDYLIKTHKIESSRIKAINGGYREWQEMELWLVPKDEKAPKATPKTFPKRKKNQ